MRDCFECRAMRTAEIEPRTILGSLRAEVTIAAHRDLPQFREAASYSRSSGSARRLSITLTRPASGVGKTWVIHVPKSDIPLDLRSLTLKQRFPCDRGSTAPIADVSLSLCEFCLAYVKAGVAALKSGKGVIRWFDCGEQDSIRRECPRSEWRYSTSRLDGIVLRSPGRCGTSSRAFLCSASIAAMNPSSQYRGRFPLRLRRMRPSNVRRLLGSSPSLCRNLP
jgi:hypothetical protein